MCVGFSNGYHDYPPKKHDLALAALVPGSAISFDRVALFHFAIFLGWAYPRIEGGGGDPEPIPLLCHMSGDANTTPRASVRLDDFRDIAQKSTVRVYRCDCGTRKRAAVIRECLFRVGETGYNAVTNNCEHFVRQVISKEHISYQTVWTFVAPLVQVPRLIAGGALAGAMCMTLSKSMPSSSCVSMRRNYRSLGLIDPELDLLVFRVSHGGLAVASLEVNPCCTREFTGSARFVEQEMHSCDSCGLAGRHVVCRPCLMRCHQLCQQPQPQPQVQQQAQKQTQQQTQQQPPQKLQPQPQPRLRRQPQSQPETQPELQPEPEPQPRLRRQPQAQPETQPELQPEPEPQLRQKPQCQPELQPDPQPQLRRKPQPELQPEPELRRKPQPELQSEPQPELQSEPQSELQPEPQSELQSEPEPQLRRKPQPELQSEPQPELQPEREPQLRRKPQPELQQEPQSELQSESQPQLRRKPQSQPALQPEPQSSPQPQPQPSPSKRVVHGFCGCTHGEQEEALLNLLKRGFRRSDRFGVVNLENQLVKTIHRFSSD